MFKKLNCQKNSDLKWHQPQDLTQPNTKTAQCKLAKYFEKKKKNNKTAISRQMYKILKAT